MAKKILIELIDDIDGTLATEMVPFGIDGVQHEIDLSETNAARLRKTLAEFVSAGRRVAKRKAKGTHRP